MKRTHKEFLHVLIFCILLFSINPYKNSIFVNIEGNLRNNGSYEPSGLIALWSGPLNTIPDGWKLCDGSDGTLNISNRFVCGTDNMEEPGITGGSSSHNHNYTTVPYHDHGETDTATCRHSHNWDGPGARLQVMEGNTVGLFNNGVTGSDPANHSHNVDYTGQAISYTSEEENILPPYYKLVFIEKEKKDAVIPIGLITMWAGTIENIPEGWAFCNGLNGTPDLREKFIRGVLPGEDPGSLGGNLSHIHTYTDIPNHTHSLSIGGYNHVHPGAFAHIPRYLHYVGPGSVRISGLSSASYTDYTDTPHTHTINEIGMENCTTQHTEHLPPYFKMAFIMNKEVTDALPVGSISMWGDSIMDIPSGWNQCNGTHNTPNMLNRFPRGIASGEQPGIIGGSTTHRHIYTEVPLHTHIVFEDPMRHRHSMVGVATPWVEFPSMPSISGIGFPVLIPSQASYSSQSNAPHNHTVNPTGSMSCYTSNESNLPPFIKLVFIQKNLLISNPSPADGAFGVGNNPTLSVDALKLEGDDLIITFYNASDNSIIEADVILGGSGTASITWSGLSYGTRHSWYVIVDDGLKSIQFETWSFTTKSPESFPFPLIITISMVSAGAIVGATTMIWLKRRRKRA